MQAAGFEPEDFEGDEVEVWPEHWTAFVLITQMQTQWRTGFSGPTGLDYTVVYRRMDRMGLTPDEYDQLEQDIGVLERAALKAMNSKTS